MDFIKNEKAKADLNQGNESGNIKQLIQINESLNIKITQLENQINNEKKKNNDLIKQVNQLQTQLKIELNKNNDLNIKINQYENIIADKDNTIMEYKNLLAQNQSEMKDLNLKYINKLNNSILGLNDNSEIYSQIINLLKEMKCRENEIKELELDEDLLQGEKLLMVKFTSTDQSVKYSMICKNTNTFNKIKKIIFQIYPNYNNNKSYFLVNGAQLDINKTLKDNKIKDKSTIILEPNE